MGFKLNWQQAEASDMCIEWYFSKNRKQVFEIVGPGGSGKTTIIASIIERAELERHEVLFMAYVGKATQALAMKGNFAKTIHSSIYDMKAIPKRNERGEIMSDNGHLITRKGFVRRDQLPEGVKLIVVDEGGMIDKNTAKDILSFGLPVIVLGDLDQLPPIFGHSFFLKAPDYKLTIVMRQKEGSPIIWLADRCRKGLPMVPGVYGDKGELVIKRKDDINLDDIEYADMMICGLNRTRDVLNDIVRNEIKKYDDFMPLNLGEKIVCRQNNWSRSLDDNIFLINGMVGFVDNIYLNTYNKNSLEIDFRPDFEEHRVFRNIKIDLKFLDLPAADGSGMMSRYNKFQYGNAISTHMSQGSQYNKVLFFMENYGSFDYRRRQAYTGVTRAEEFLTVAID